MTTIFATGINTFSDVDLAVNADGSFAVVWEGQNRELVTITFPNGTEVQSSKIVSAGVYVQRFDASGNALSDPTELFLETGTGFNVMERSTSIAALPGGAVIVAYLTAPDSGSSPNQIVVREFSPTGVETSPATTIEAAGVNTFSDVDLAVNVDGSFTVVWEGQNRELVTTTFPNGTVFQSKVIVSAGVYVQRFDASGSALSDPTELSLETGTGFNVTERSTSIAALPGGGVIVAYLTAPDSGSTPNQIVIREFSPTGVETSPAFTIEASGINTFSDVDLAVNADGSFAVVWEGQNRELVTITFPNGTEFQSKVIVSEGVYAQRFDASGTALSDPIALFLVTGTTQQSVSITALPDGDDIVAYLASPSSTSSPTQIVLIKAGENAAPIVTSDGGGETASVSINENATAVTTVTATDADSGQTLTYSIFGGDDAALFTIEEATGVLTFVTAPDFETPTDAGGDSAYEVVVEVSDGVGGTDTQALTVTVINIAGTTLAGGNGNQTLTGTNEEDVISGGNGNEVLNGGDGSDTISGGNGNDVLNGGSGNDASSGGNGNDVLNGGSGDDTDSGGNGDDILNGGSGDDTGLGGNGNDILDGGEGDDILNGSNGMDILIGGIGDDTVTGGNGVDTVVFATGFGNDVITDFSNDLVRFDHVLFANFAAVKARSAQVGADTVITYDAANTVTLVGVALASLDASDFQFV